MASLLAACHNDDSVSDSADVVSFHVRDRGLPGQQVVPEMVPLAEAIRRAESEAGVEFELPTYVPPQFSLNSLSVELLPPGLRASRDGEVRAEYVSDDSRAEPGRIVLRVIEGADPQTPSDESVLVQPRGVIVTIGSSGEANFTWSADGAGYILQGTDVPPPHDEILRMIGSFADASP